MTIPQSVASKMQLQDELMENITRGKHNFKKSPKERITKVYCETRLDVLEKSYAKFVSTHLEIVSELESKILKSSSYYKSDCFESTENFYIDYKSELMELIQKLTPSCSNNSDNNSPQNQPHKTHKIHIPVVNIPTFSGDYTKWPSFRDLFKSLIDKNLDLDEVQKLQYLKCHISGEPEALLRQLSITEDNYSIAWKKLESRYDNKKFLGNQIFARFFGLKGSSIESSSSIAFLLDSMNEFLESFNKLGVDTSTWDLFVIYHITERLDPVSRKEWEAQASSTNDFNTLNEFSEFLQHKFKSIAYLEKPKARGISNKTVFHIAEGVTPATECIVPSSGKCQFCKGNHKINKCHLFKNEPLNKRRDFVKNTRLCFNCFGNNHRVFACRQSTRCSQCGRKHNTLLHSDSIRVIDGSDGEEKLVADNAMLDETKSSSKVVSCNLSGRSQVLLATALVNIQTNSSCMGPFRCLLDQGSQASFITESAVQRLSLKKSREEVSVSGVGDGDKSVVANSVVYVKVQSIYDSTCVFEVKLWVLRRLTTFLPSKKVEVHMWNELKSLELADPRFDVPGKVDILLGAEVYSQIIMEGVRRGPLGCPVAQRTMLGWILSGLTDSSTIIPKIVVHNAVISAVDVPEDKLLRKFWELEAEPSVEKDLLTEEEKKCEELFEKTTKRDDEGRYIVKLPFQTEKPVCGYGNLRDIAAKCLFRLERRLSRDTDLKLQYSNGMDTYLELNHMEPVPASDRDKERTVYLPHHPVIRSDKTTTKVRIVFNASQKGYNGISLNDELLSGPKLQPDLRHLIMRWRSHPICISADIVKMYLQIKIAEEDTDLLRLLWRDKNGRLEHYRMLRVTFGTASAPYLAVKALQQLAVDEGEKYPFAAERVIKDYYMDDLMTGCDSIDEALKIHKDMNQLLEKGGFTLQKWISNSREFLEKAGELQERNEKGIEMEKETEGIRKVLGLNWDSILDNFKYTVNLPEIVLPVTKRRVISDISRLFDPLGFLAPVIITAKIFIQKLWISGIDWDQELPSNLLQEWLIYREDLNRLTGFNLNRWLEMRSDDKVIELQGFCDASGEAYGAVVYVRVVDRDGNVHVNMITSKTKVAPVKQISIPRLELCGAVLLAKLLDEVSRVLKIPKEKVLAWTDSTIVLDWLSSHPRKWNTFVANRVSEIITLFNRKHWNHVGSGENPADLASRGMKPAEFVDNMLWKKGPKWLSKDTKVVDSHEEYSPLEEEYTKVVDSQEEYSPLEEEVTKVVDSQEAKEEIKINIALEEEVTKVADSQETKEEIEIICCISIAKEEDRLFVRCSTMKKHWQSIQKLVQDFWRRLSQEYLFRFFWQ